MPNQATKQLYATKSERTPAQRNLVTNTNGPTTNPRPLQTHHNTRPGPQQQQRRTNTNRRYQSGNEQSPSSETNQPPHRSTEQVPNLIQRKQYTPHRATRITIHTTSNNPLNTLPIMKTRLCVPDGPTTNQLSTINRA